MMVRTCTCGNASWHISQNGSQPVLICNNKLCGRQMQGIRKFNWMKVVVGIPLRIVILIITVGVLELDIGNIWPDDFDWVF